MRQSFADFQQSVERLADSPEAAVTALVRSVDSKSAAAAVQALRRFFPEHATAAALAHLLDWLIVQSPLYPDLLETLTAARHSPVLLTLLQDRLRFAEDSDDDEAVRNYLDLANRLDLEARLQLVPSLHRLALSSHPAVREALVDALLDLGALTIEDLREILTNLSATDSDANVRTAARAAMERLVAASSHSSELRAV
jgi:hypothetical protein